MSFKLLAVYGAFEALLLLCSAFFGRAWFYSSQTAFLGSLLVLAATFRAYKKRVENGVREYDGSAGDENDEWDENHEEFPDMPQNAKFDGFNPHPENAKKAAGKFDADGGLNLSGSEAGGEFDERNLGEQTAGERAKFDEANLSQNASERVNFVQMNEPNLMGSSQDAQSKFGELNLNGANQSGQSNLSEINGLNLDRTAQGERSNLIWATESNLNKTDQSNQTNLNKNSEQNLTAASQSENGQARPQLKSRNFARNLKQNSPNYFTAFVPFRLIAYAVLVVGFLSLQRHGNLDLAAFLVALAAMPVGALIYGVKSNEN